MHHHTHSTWQDQQQLGAVPVPATVLLRHASPSPRCALSQLPWPLALTCACLCHPPLLAACLPQGSLKAAVRHPIPGPVGCKPKIDFACKTGCPGEPDQRHAGLGAERWTCRAPLQPPGRAGEAGGGGALGSGLGAGAEEALGTPAQVQHLQEEVSTRLSGSSAARAPTPHPLAQLWSQDLSQGLGRSLSPLT